MRESRLEFIRQQGFASHEADDRLYSALMLQPRIIAMLVVLGALLESAGLFIALSAVLWWSTLVPARSPFDGAYNLFVARPRGFRRLEAARPPRRFAQAMAAAFALMIGASHFSGFIVTARIMEGLFIASAASVVFRDFCGPANLFNSFRSKLGAAPIESAGGSL
jgi:hypothetical protein